MSQFYRFLTSFGFLLLLSTSLYSQTPPDAPAFSHAGGFYTQGFDLVLSGDGDDILIYYTLDGSEPDSSSRLYENAINIESRAGEANDISMIPTNQDVPSDEAWQEPVGEVFKATVVRAVAYRDGEASPRATHTYFVDPDIHNRYSLPVFSISTDREHFFSDETGIYVHGDDRNYRKDGPEWERPIHLEFFEPGGEPGFSQEAGARIHGGASRSRPVKNLRIYARSDYGQSWIDYKLFPDVDTNEFKRFMLRNSGDDWNRSYFRDGFMQELIAHTGVAIQHYRPTIVFINGEFWGIKNMRQRYDHRYFETTYGVDRDDLVYLTNNAQRKEGNDQDVADFLALRHFINTEDMNETSNYEEISRQIDIENFQDYHIAQIYYRNTDWPGNNIDFWRTRNDYDPDAPHGQDGRWRWLLFDTDYGYNLDFDYVPGSPLYRDDDNVNHNDYMAVLI